MAYNELPVTAGPHQVAAGSDWDCSFRGTHGRRARIATHSSYLSPERDWDECGAGRLAGLCASVVECALFSSTFHLSRRHGKVQA